MTPTRECLYEFGGFTLDADERELLYSNERIELSARDFDVLVHMVRNPKRLIPNAELIAGVWGDEPKIVARNITHHVAKVRKALDCDPRSPTFIETVAKRGYRFIADVKEIESNGERIHSPDAPAKEEFLITSDMFVPVFLGSKCYDEIKGSKKDSHWLSFKELQIDDGRLCILANGFGVWHLTKTARFPSMSVIARWRRQTYEQILKGKNEISGQIERLTAASQLAKGDLFSLKLGEPGYVFSSLVMNEPRWSNTTRIKNALQLLSCLTPLESKLKQKKEDELALERRILEDGFSDTEMLEFGLRGKDVGFASWNGVSYYQQEETISGLGEDLVEFEIAVHAIWWFSKCLSDEMTTAGKSTKAAIGQSIYELKDMFAKIESIGPQDTASQRTMMEAILTTSRLERLVNETIRQYERL